MKRLQGKVAVITGGNSGIGLATAKRFLEEGAKVAISGRNPKTLEEAAKSLGGDVLAVQADTASIKDTEAFLEKVGKKFGKIDVLFINAGIAKFEPLATTTEALFDEQFNTNVKGAYFTLQKALPLLNDGASVILNTSVVSTKGMATASVYSATKAALRSLARTATAELQDRKIRVNAVAPGPIVTPIFGRTGMSQADQDAMATQLASMVPMKRIGQADEVAGAVAFLASADSSYVTGVELNVDGGMGEL